MTEEKLRASERTALIKGVDRRLDIVGLLSNGLGAAIVFVFFTLLGPGEISDEEFDDVLRRSLVGFAIYMPMSLVLGRWFAGKRPYEPIREWLESGRPATDAERRLVLRYPWVWTWRSSVFWVGGAFSFSLLNISLGAGIATGVFAIAVLGGVTACALQYLMVERVMRPITALALAGKEPERLETPGVAARLTMAWALATGVALLGIVVLTIAKLAGAAVDLGGILFLAVSGIIVGSGGILLAARSVADPLAGVRRGLERIERRDFEARVDVDDGSEVGLLQAGFNRMAEGLAERERIREALGTYVDPEVAELILTEGPDLSGEAVDATILFADIVDFTSWAERASASDVVETLNRLFEEVVPVIHKHGGHVDKFIGDGLMAVFGAPRRHPDHADRALAAATEIAELVATEFGPDLRLGLGLNSGPVVAGNIGGAGRLDFSVIGDAVNVAARVEAATRETGDTILLTGATRKLLTDSTVECERRPPVPLKGKSEPVELYAPARVLAG